MSVPVFRKVFYTKHHLKFGKNQADNLEYMRFRRRFFPVFFWCLVLVLYIAENEDVFIVGHLWEKYVLSEQLFPLIPLLYNICAVLSIPKEYIWRII